MEAESRQKIQIVLAIAIAVVAIRTGYILYDRYTESQPVKTEAPAPLNPDYYVTPKKLYPYDLKSAKQLTQQPAWVKVGNSITFYLFNEATRRSDFSHEKGLLGPLQKLNIKNVVLDASPGSPDQKQIMAIFEDGGKEYSFPIGVFKNDNYTFYSDEMLFIQDPHQLYKHWSADIWTTIDQHQLKPGMNELQADFSVGLGIPQDSGDSSMKTVSYANNGKPLMVTYNNGKITDVKPGSRS
jgi:hypothetical protein